MLRKMQQEISFPCHPMCQAVNRDSRLWSTLQKVQSVNNENGLLELVRLVSCHQMTYIPPSKLQNPFPHQHDLRTLVGLMGHLNPRAEQAIFWQSSLYSPPFPKGKKIHLRWQVILETECGKLCSTFRHAMTLQTSVDLMTPDQLLIIGNHESSAQNQRHPANATRTDSGLSTGNERTLPTQISPQP